MATEWQEGAGNRGKRARPWDPVRLSAHPVALRYAPGALVLPDPARATGRPGPPRYRKLPKRSIATRYVRIQREIPNFFRTSEVIPRTSPGCHGLFSPGPLSWDRDLDRIDIPGGPPGLQARRAPPAGRAAAKRLAGGARAWPCHAPTAETRGGGRAPWGAWRPSIRGGVPATSGKRREGVALQPARMVPCARGRARFVTHTGSPFPPKANQGTA